jgi:hypothetical protein
MCRRRGSFAALAVTDPLEHVDGAVHGEIPDPPQMCVDHAANGCDQTWHVVPIEPAAALWVDDGFQLVDHERNIPAAPEHGADHACQRHCPSMMLERLRIDENLERPPSSTNTGVVDRDVKRVCTGRPRQLVGEA